MQKFIIFVMIALVIIFGVMYAGGNTSSSENVLDMTQSQSKISEILTAIDVAGKSAYSNVWIESSAFQGEIEQPASSAVTPITTFIIKNNGSNKLELGYASKKITVTHAGAYAGAQIVDANLPAQSRTLGTEIADPIVLSDVNYPNIAPIIKNPTASKWLELFLFDANGLALDRLSEYNAVWTALKGDNAKQQDFMKWVFGDGATPDWSSYKVNRIVSVRQINTDTLTGLDRNNSTVSSLLNKDNVYLYNVDNVNNKNFINIETGGTFPVPTDVKTALGALNETKFILDVANHLNQVIGSKTLLIPNSDSTVMYDADGNPMFKLN